MSGSTAPVFGVDLPGCTIHLTEERGITLRQMQTLMCYIVKHCEAKGWHDRGGNHSGKAVRNGGESLQPLTIHRQGGRLQPLTITFYQVVDWVIEPAILARKCSFVELLADGPQRPRWCVSHWMGMPSADLVACLKEHCVARSLAKDIAPYWLHTFAANPPPVAQSAKVLNTTEVRAFQRALEITEGTIAVVDRRGLCFTRSWCCYEAFLALEAQRREEAPKLFDVFSTAMLEADSASEAVGMIDGYAERDRRSGEVMQRLFKYERERHFPVANCVGALKVDVVKAKTSEEADRTYILNSIAGSDNVMGEDCPAGHELYDRLNDDVRSHFAVVLWRLAAEAGGDMRPFQAALQRSCQESLSIYFGKYKLPDDKMELLSAALPRSLQRVILDFSDSELGDAGLTSLGRGLSKIGALEDIQIGLASLNFQMPRCQRIGDAGLSAFAEFLPAGLVSLELTFPFCSGFGDAGLSALCRCLPASLTSLSLSFQGCKVGEAGLIALGRNLPGGVTVLSLELGFTRINDEGLVELGKGLPESLTELSLNAEYCREVGDEGVAGVARRLPMAVSKLKLKVDMTCCTVRKRDICRSLKDFRRWQKELQKDEEENEKEEKEEDTEVAAAKSRPASSDSRGECSYLLGDGSVQLEESPGTAAADEPASPWAIVGRDSAGTFSLPLFRSWRCKAPPAKMTGAGQQAMSEDRGQSHGLRQGGERSDSATVSAFGGQGEHQQRLAANAHPGIAQGWPDNAGKRDAPSEKTRQRRLREARARLLACFGCGRHAAAVAHEV